MIGSETSMSVKIISNLLPLPTLLFNFAHYAIRPWPWILVALSSIIVFPNLNEISKAFPHVDPSIIGHDLAYPAMLTYLPQGLLGLVVASLIAAYMSTMSTSLNWGSSYVVNDFYKRFLKPEASERELVAAGRISTVVMMILASTFALILESALQTFNVLLQIGAGTGLLYILRWFWYRINAYSELTGMVVSFLVALFFLILNNYHEAQIEILVAGGIDYNSAFEKVGGLKTYEQLIIGIGITTLSWLIVTFITKPAEKTKLEEFYRHVHPGGPGWKKVISNIKKSDMDIEIDKSSKDLPLGILGMFVGCIAVYGFLFATGYWLYAKYLQAIYLSIVTVLSLIVLFKLWNKINNSKR